MLALNFLYALLATFLVMATEFVLIRTNLDWCSSIFYYKDITAKFLGFVGLLLVFHEVTTYIFFSTGMQMLPAISPY